MKIENSYGTIYIAPQVIANITSETATHCFGVVGLAARKRASDIVTLLRRESSDKGIKISSDDNGLIIELSIIAKYGVNLKAISDSVIDNVKYNVENLTGFTVKQVRVHIEDIRMDE